MIGYRIPTEGKQSVVIMRVVEFLPDTYDSTVVLPDEWVAQSGSDFDVDSVYAMTFGLTKIKMALLLVMTIRNSILMLNQIVLKVNVDI